MSAKGVIRFNAIKAGELWRDGAGVFYFRYTDEYLARATALPIARCFPIRAAIFTSTRLFPFFENLLSEGWLRETQSELQKIDEEDSYQLLLNNGHDLVGAVSVHKIEET